MPNLSAKQDLKDELVQALTDQLEILQRAHRATLEGATHEEAKPENDKDTRALEQSYVARGQALRIDELQRELGEVLAMQLRMFGPGMPVALGALLTVHENGAVLRFFMAPHGGGTLLAGRTVQVVTPKSPLGRALLGKTAGELCETLVGGRARELDLSEVV